MEQCRVTVLGIGQGSSNLIEIFDDANPDENIFVGLIDCGSDDKKESENVKNSIDKIVEAMTRHVESGHIVPPFLDMLLITHQDKDHWDKLDMIFDDVKGVRQDMVDDLPVKMCVPETPLLKVDIFTDKRIKQISVEETYYFMEMIPDESPEGYQYKADQVLSINNTEIKAELEVVYEVKKAGGYDRSIHMDLFVDFYSLSCNVEYLIDHKKIDWEIEYGEDDEEGDFSFYKVNDKYCFFANEECVELLDSFELGKVFKESLVLMGLTDDLLHEWLSLILDDYAGFLGKITTDYLVNQITEGFEIKRCIGKVFIGGESSYESTSFKNMKKKLKDLSIGGSVSLTDSNTNINVPGLEDGIVTLICCKKFGNLNYNSGDTSPSIKKNATGAVVLFNLGSKMLFSGDATVHTMFYMTSNDLLHQSNNCIFVAPHHGSGTTSKDSKSTLTWTELDKFIKAAKPKEVIISAGYKNHHGHPNGSFVEVSLKNLAAGTNKVHNLYVNTGLSGKKDLNYTNNHTTTKAVYTTLINDVKDPSTEIGYAHFIYILTDPSKDSYSYIAKVENMTMPTVPLVASKAVSRADGIDLNEIDFIGDSKRGDAD